jgi:NADH:ubiquinone oxidoreductase subunit 6 (subunit J)
VQTVGFWALAVLAVASGLLVFRLDSMARVTFALLTSFLSIGGELILLGLDYLGVVVILMMVMEMVIMAVFMIAFMMNPAGLMPMSMTHNKRGAAAISLATFTFLAAGIIAVSWPQGAGGAPPDPTLQMGESLMSGQMLTMMTLGFALLATIVAATVLATHRGRYDRFGDDLDRRIPDDPVAGGVGR